MTQPQASQAAQLSALIFQIKVVEGEVAATLSTLLNVADKVESISPTHQASIAHREAVEELRELLHLYSEAMPKRAPLRVRPTTCPTCFCLHVGEC